MEFFERRRTEWERLQRLAGRSQGHLEVRASSPDLSEFIIELHNIPAPVGSDEENLEITREHRLRLYLPPDFPVSMPVLTFERPLFHPNCWPDGTYCHGDQWFPARHLDELLINVVQDIQLWGPNAYNLESPANLAAHRCYRDEAWVRRLRDRIQPVPFPPPASGGTHSPSQQDIRVVRSGRTAQPSRPTIRVIRR